MAEHGSSGVVPHAKSSLTRLSRDSSPPQSYGIRRGSLPCLPLRYDLRDLHTRGKRGFVATYPVSSRGENLARGEGIDPREDGSCRDWEGRYV